jgi:hypothetical protein
MPTGPPDQSPPAEADSGPSHDAITAELLDLTWQFLTHASPTVRAELGQFLADHGQHPVAGLGAFLDCLQLSAARHHPRDAHGERTPPRSTGGVETRSHNTRPHSAGGAELLPTWGQKSFSKFRTAPASKIPVDDPPNGLRGGPAHLSAPG